MFFHKFLSLSDANIARATSNELEGMPHNDESGHHTPHSKTPHSDTEHAAEIIQKIKLTRHTAVEQGIQIVLISLLILLVQKFNVKCQMWIYIAHSRKKNPEMKCMKLVSFQHAAIFQLKTVYFPYAYVHL